MMAIHHEQHPTNVHYPFSRQLYPDQLQRIYGDVDAPVYEPRQYSREEFIFGMYVGAFLGIMFTVAVAWVVAVMA